MSDWMTNAIDWNPGNDILEFVLVVTLGVTLVSSVAWLVAKRLAGNAAVRHLVLFSALVCCLASPTLSWFCEATGLALVSVPLFRGEQTQTSPMVTSSEAGPICLSTGMPTASPPITASNAAAATAMPVLMAACCPETSENATNQVSVTSTIATADVQPIDGTASVRVSFRGVATGAMCVWAAGVLLLLLRLARDCWCVIQLRRSSHPAQDERLLTLSREIAGKLGLRRVPLLLVSPRTIIPLAIGFGRPAVLLPKKLLAVVNDDELQDILSHELAHLKRGDLRIVLLQELARSLYWPIVPVHALNRELQRAREDLCDNVVLARRDAIAYGETLLHVAEVLVQARPLGAAVGIIDGCGELERRIARLLDPRRCTMTTTGPRTAFAVMVLFLFGGAIASTTRFAEAAGDEDDAVHVLDMQTDNAAGPRDESATEPKPEDSPHNMPEDAATAEALLNSLSQNTKFERLARNDPWFNGIGDLTQTSPWKKRLPLAESQAKAITLLDALVWHAMDRSDLTEHGVQEKRSSEGEETRDRYQARRLAVLDHAQAMVRFGLLTPAQAEFVTARSLSREQGRLSVLEHDGVVQELLGLSDRQKEQFSEARPPVDAAVKAILTPAQLELWSRLLTEKSLPIVPPDLPAVSEAEANRIRLEELSVIFRQVDAKEKGLRLSEDQRRAITVLKDLTQRGLVWIDRRSASEPADRIDDSRQRFLKHAEQFLLQGILTERQALTIALGC
ncbi:MAG: M56 family metallopeptidase [Planctomycetaceae bacterium]